MILALTLGFILFTAGLFMIFRVKLTHIFNLKPNFKINKDIKQIKIEKIIPKKPGYFERRRLEAQEVLKQGQLKMDYNKYLQLVFVCAGSGFVIGLFFNNIILSIILATALTYAPVQFFKFKQISYVKALDDQLITVLNVVTNAYIQSNDIIKAVKESIPRIDEPLASVFKEFIIETSYISSNTARAIEKMSSKVTNRFFKSWCNDLILCQNDSDFKSVLPSTIKKMSNYMKKQIEFDTALFSIVKEYVIVAALFIFILPGMRILNRQWFEFLVDTTAGKIIVAVAFTAFLWSIAYVIKVNKPLSQS